MMPETFMIFWNYRKIQDKLLKRHSKWMSFLCLIFFVNNFHFINKIKLKYRREIYMDKIDEILESLSREQKIAATTTEGNIRLVAGAGSGKTNTLTKRVAYICQKNNISPERILSVTFTNKAAEEMKQRVSSYMEIPEDELEMMTFHCLALNICKRDLYRMGFPKITDINGNEETDILIGSTPLAVLAKDLFDKNADELSNLSDEDAEYFKSRVIKYANSVVKAHKYADFLTEEITELNSVSDVIEYERKKDEIGKEKGKLDRRMGDIRKEIKENFKRSDGIYALLGNLRNLKKEKDSLKVEKSGDAPTLSWAKALIQMKAATKVIDFDDIIMFAEYLLENYQEVRDYWQNKYDYIQVDEFQDTDWRQLNILKLLSEKSKGLFVVGDPDQSIYIFRGVLPEVFNTLDEHLDNLQTIYMEDNYRSSNAVIQAANAVIELNKNRLKKTLVPKSGIKDMAAPLLCVGTSAYTAAQLEFKQIQKMIKKGVNPNNICVLYRDKNCVVTEELVAMLKKTDIPLDNQFKSITYAETFSDAVLNILKYRYSKGVNFLGNMIENVFGEGYDKVFDPTQVDSINLDANSIFEFIQNIYPKNYSVKTGNPIGKYKKFVEAAGEIEVVVSQTVEEWDSMSEAEKVIACSEDSIMNNEQDAVDGIHIMTIHKSKGLEFDYVFCNSMDGGMCPKYNSFTNIDSLEEDVRLAYVAITRAKKQVYLGVEQMTTISPFIAQVSLAIEPIHASSVQMPDTSNLYNTVAEFNSVLDMYYLLKDEGVYRLEYNGAVVGYRYALMLDGSRIYLQATWNDIIKAKAIPDDSIIKGVAEVAEVKNGIIISYEKINETVPVYDISDTDLLNDLFVKNNPIRTLEALSKSKVA